MEIPWTAADRTGAPAGAVVMASRFELKTAWRSPLFLVHSMRLWRQARRSPGVLGVSLRAAPLKGVFWTLSAWTDRAALGRYARTDPHTTVRAKIRDWTEDSSFVYWEVPAADLPAGPKDAAGLWTEAERRVSAERAGGPPGALL